MRKLLSVAFALLYPLLATAEPATASDNLKLSTMAKDEHPEYVSGVATQLLTIHSNSRTTCVFVSARGYLGAWRAQTADSSWNTMTTGDGWRFCTKKHGDLSLRLEHLFQRPANYWPVRVTVKNLP